MQQRTKDSLLVEAAICVVCFTLVFVIALYHYQNQLRPAQHEPRPTPTSPPPAVILGYDPVSLEDLVAQQGFRPELVERSILVCEQFAAGGLSEYDIDIQMSNEGWTDDERWFALDLNIEKYCPEYLYLVR